MADNDVKREWRVGHKVPINVYEGDRPVCQCQTAEYAALIVEAVNAHSRASQPSDRVAEPILDMMNHDLAADADLSLDPSDELRRRVAAESRVAELEREVERLRLNYSLFRKVIADLVFPKGYAESRDACEIEQRVKLVMGQLESAESQLTALRESQKEVAEMKAALTKIAKGEHDPYRSPDGLARDALAALANGTPRP
jgi:prefoldin subunit 5